MKKKILAIVLSLVLVAGIVCVFAACGNNEPEDKEPVETVSDLQYIKDKGVMVIGVTEYEPMNYLEGDKWVGFDTEFAEAVCAKLGVKAEFKIIDWDLKATELKTKKIDAVWNGMTILEELKASMALSDAYAINGQIIVTKAENAEKYKDGASLNGVMVAVEAGSAGEKEAIKCEGADVVPLKTQADTLMEVKAGTAECAVIDSTMAKSMTGEGTDYEGLVYTGLLSEEFYGIGTRLDSDLCAELNKIMAEMKADGSLEKISDKYGVILAE